MGNLTLLPSWTYTLNFMVYSHVRLKVNVSRKINYFPGFYNIVDYYDCLPSLSVKDKFFPYILELSYGPIYNFPIIVFSIMNPFDCCTLGALGTRFFFYTIV